MRLQITSSTYSIAVDTLNTDGDGILVTHITLNIHTFGIHNLLGRQTLYGSGLEVL